MGVVLVRRTCAYSIAVFDDLRSVVLMHRRTVLVVLAVLMVLTVLKILTVLRILTVLC